LFEKYENCIPRIPFKVVLRDYAQWISQQENFSTLFHYLAFHMTKEAARDTRPEDIQKLVKLNPILLILDGLDEVPEKDLRRKVVDNITSFVDQVRRGLEGNLKVVATTRPYGYSEEFAPTHNLHLAIQDFELDQAQDYVQRWMRVREPIPDEAERIQSTFEDCLKDEVICVLTQTPLQVTILLVIIRARGRPPNQREELFDSYMNIIYLRE
jgi:predicted NACHT family NTPase